jgi:hypothetical protein
MTGFKKSFLLIFLLSILLSSCTGADSPTEKIIRDDFKNSAKQYNTAYRNLIVKDVSNGEIYYSVSVRAEVMRNDSDEWTEVFGVFDLKKSGDTYTRDETTEWCLMFSSKCG